MYLAYRQPSPAARLAMDAESLFRNVLSTGRPFAVNLVETPAAFVLTAALPGVPRDRIDVAARDQALHITIAAAPAASADDSQVVGQEFGSFEGTRQFSYHPDRIDAKGMSAKLADGILTVSLPKKDPEQHRIDIG